MGKAARQSKRERDKQARSNAQHAFNERFHHGGKPVKGKALPLEDFSGYVPGIGDSIHSPMKKGEHGRRDEN